MSKIKSCVQLNNSFKKALPVEIVFKKISEWSNINVVQQLSNTYNVTPENTHSECCWTRAIKASPCELNPTKSGSNPTMSNKVTKKFVGYISYNVCYGCAAYFMMMYSYNKLLYIFHSSIPAATRVIE